MFKDVAVAKLTAVGRKRGLLLIAAIAVLITACEEPRPRTFADFMEDRIAREGTLARCNADREATLNDIECANARRAAGAIALRQERDRSAALQLESERKLTAMREEVSRRDFAARQAAAAAAEAAQKAYEAIWESSEVGAIPSVAGTPGLEGVDISELTSRRDGLSLINVPSDQRSLPDLDEPRLEEIAVPQSLGRRAN